MGPDTPLVRALGDKTAKPLAEHLQLETVGQLLAHYPRRYVERGQLTDATAVVLGEHVTVSARVKQARARKTSTGKWLVEAIVADESGDLRLTFFAAQERMARWHVSRLPEGEVKLFSGRVRLYKGRLELSHPEVLKDHDGALVPLYPAKEQVSSDTIATSVRTVLPVADLADPLPEALREEHELLPLETALRWIHLPEDWQQVGAARKRLKWDEAFVLQTHLAQRRVAALSSASVPRLGRAGGARDAFDADLPFVLTAGQREVGDVLDAELALPHPMHRLLQGEVGSGKTVVALRAMLRVVDSGAQTALLAPTEVLAQQHLRSLRAMLGPLATAGELGSPEEATRVVLLTGSLTAAQRRAALAEIADGSAGIVVGTHALISEDVAFRDLGLVVVDEQHRFGVEQRDLLRAKGASPHTLVMTATPIPRTIAMTVYGDLETSTLRELPAGRSPLTTHVVGLGTPAYDRAWQRVREEVGQGRQAFVVCPRIGGDEKEPELDDEGKRPALAVLDVHPELAAGALAGLRLELLHGRMTPDAKDDAMTRFARGEVDVLVATTVIEVGVDVPNATVMVVLDADRFGISQLHQLRGRVGRGGHAGLCLLVTDAERESAAGERLAAVAASADGFELARVDLELRREGDVLGTRQAGVQSKIKVLNVLQDEEVILAARAAAAALVEQDPDLERHPALRAAVAGLVREDDAAYLEKG